MKRIKNVLKTLITRRSRRDARYITNISKRVSLDMDLGSLGRMKKVLGD
ncbi:MAG: hypothetical protein ABII18_00785 [bacterium]|nr:hypothetical protein [bacterium]